MPLDIHGVVADTCHGQVCATTMIQLYHKISSDTKAASHPKSNLSHCLDKNVFALAKDRISLPECFLFHFA